MRTEALKKKIVSAINKQEDKGLLEFFYAVLAEQSNVSRISKKQYNKEIDEVTKQIVKGKTIAHESVVKDARKWLKK